MTEVMTKPICKTVTCKRELTFLEDSKCWRCLVCNPLPSTSPTVEPEKKYLDVKMTEERVREIVRDELENWYIQRPPVTRDETKNLTASEVSLNEEISAPSTVPITDELLAQEAVIVDPPNWRRQAKALGIRTSQRKKVDVLAEIAEKTKT